jgi:hypothetical protein
VFSKCVSQLFRIDDYILYPTQRTVNGSLTSLIPAKRRVNCSIISCFFLSELYLNSFITRKTDARENCTMFWNKGNRRREANYKFKMAENYNSLENYEHMSSSSKHVWTGQGKKENWMLFFG